MNNNYAAFKILSLEHETPLELGKEHLAKPSYKEVTSTLFFLFNHRFGATLLNKNLYMQ